MPFVAPSIEELATMIDGFLANVEFIDIAFAIKHGQIGTSYHALLTFAERN